jgi:hypothetical protein
VCECRQVQAIAACTLTYTEDQNQATTGTPPHRRMHVPFECPGMTPFGLVAESNPRVLACVGHPSRLSDPSFFLSICLAHFRRSTMARPYLCLAFSHSGARKRHGKKRMSIFAPFFWPLREKKEVFACCHSRRTFAGLPVWHYPA